MGRGDFYPYVWATGGHAMLPNRASVPRTVVRYVLTSPSAGRVRERAPSGREGGGGERAKWTIYYTCSLICLRIPTTFVSLTTGITLQPLV